MGPGDTTLVLSLDTSLHHQHLFLINEVIPLQFEDDVSRLCFFDSNVRPVLRVPRGGGSCSPSFLFPLRLSRREDSEFCEPQKN